MARDINRELFDAVVADDGNKILSLLSQGADIGVKDEMNQTPFVTAVECEKFNAFKVLLDSGADLNDKFEDGTTVAKWLSGNDDDMSKRMLAEVNKRAKDAAPSTKMDDSDRDSVGSCESLPQYIY